MMADRPDLVVPILRAGVLARQFCERVAFANVEAVFERCIYLRCGDDFVCIGEPDIGNAPMTLIGNLRTLPSLKSLAGQVALICNRHIMINNSIRFTLDQSALWCASGWPECPPRDRLMEIRAALVSRSAIDAPQEGLARCVAAASETSGRAPPLARVARPRIALFERWLSGLLGDRHAPAVVSREVVSGLIGLGPGLTPSGDDFLVGALALLDAIGERHAHAALGRAITDALPGLTTPLSACFLKAASAGYIGEKVHRVVSSVIGGDVDAASAIAASIGHSSGWDMMAGIVTTLRIAAGQQATAIMQAWVPGTRRPAPAHRRCAARRPHATAPQ